MKTKLKPIIVLMLICLFTSTALALTNEKTASVIAQTEKTKAEEAQKEVLPEADSFTQLSLTGLPPSVTEVYEAQNGAGYVLLLSTKGYGGDMRLICGMDKDGKITSCKTLSQSETQGLGSKITEAKFSEQFIGKDSSLEDVETISGATISSKAYIGAIKDAFTAFELAREAA